MTLKLFQHDNSKIYCFTGQLPYVGTFTFWKNAFVSCTHTHSKSGITILSLIFVDQMKAVVECSICFLMSIVRLCPMLNKSICADIVLLWLQCNYYHVCNGLLHLAFSWFKKSRRRLVDNFQKAANFFFFKSFFSYPNSPTFRFGRTVLLGRGYKISWLKKTLIIILLSITVCLWNQTNKPNRTPRLWNSNSFSWEMIYFNPHVPMCCFIRISCFTFTSF